VTRALFVPGLLCTGDVFAPQRAALSPALEIEIADHQGADSIEGIAGGILARAPGRFVLVGLSLGGIIALEMALRAPERIEALVLIDTSARADTSEQAARRRCFITFAAQDGLRRAMEKSIPLMLAESRQEDPRLRETLFAMAEACGLDVFSRQQGALAGRRDYVGRLGAVSCPTLVIAGEADAMTPPELAGELAAGIPGARLEIVAGCGHLSTLECPEEVTALIAAFLRGHGLMG